jgi:hypothetical protein
MKLSAGSPLPSGKRIDEQVGLLRRLWSEAPLKFDHRCDRTCNAALYMFGNVIWFQFFEFSYGKFVSGSLCCKMSFYIIPICVTSGGSALSHRCTRVE